MCDEILLCSRGLLITKKLANNHCGSWQLLSLSVQQAKIGFFTTNTGGRRVKLMLPKLSDVQYSCGALRPFMTQGPWNDGDSQYSAVQGHMQSKSSRALTTILYRFSMLFQRL